MNLPPNREVALFSAALELPAGQRAAYLDEACADDPALRLRLEALLRVHDEAIPFLEAPPLRAEESFTGADGPDATMRLSNSAAEKAGDRIGRYKLLQQIGEGGCGVVYMAEQEKPVRRRVALKVIKLGMDTKKVIARFEAERQALALMDHPNIAKVLEAGATETGRPFFVMELVRGIKITDYCDDSNLSTRERLDVFVQVCQAVQHAHQKGIIHRDLKPSNILVADHDGVPVPKVIDFGVAKATTDQRLTDKTLFTAFAQFIGTPAYMSPEQARMSGLDIDTRTDIYSLGVLLYELLTGKTPLDQKELLASGLDEMRRTICENEPARPSTRLSTMLAVELTATAKHRHTDSLKLVHLLRGDLDWIVMKALEKDRARRYDTANGLAMDVQRYLADEPVVARPPSKLYRFEKLARRNKVAFAATGAVAAALMIGLVVSTSLLLKERKARRRAVAAEKKSQTEAAKATAISDFLQEMLRSANPDDLKGSDYTVRQLLDDFSAGLGKQLAGQAEVEATVRATIGNAYRRLGVTDKAEPHLERALALRRRIYGDQSEEVAQSLVDHAWNLFEQARLSEAEAEARQALDIYRKRGTGAQLVIHALWTLQLILGSQERSKEVETAVEEALALARNSPQRDFPEIANMLHSLASANANQAQYVDAENLALRAVEMHRRLQGPEHPETAWSLLVLGRALEGQHKLAEAERAYREALAIFRRYYSLRHKSVQTAFLKLNEVLEAKGDSAGLEALAREQLGAQASGTLGRLAEAKSIYREAAERGGAPELNAFAWFLATCPDPNLRDGTNAVVFAEKAVAATNRKNPSYLDTLAAAYAETGQFASAISIEQGAIALLQNEQEKKDYASRLKLYQNNSPCRNDGSLAELAGARLSEGKFAEAEGLARECLVICELETPDDWRTFNTRSMLGGALLGQKQYAEAEPLLVSGYEGMKQRENGIPAAGKPRLKEALQRLVQLYEATNRPDQAAERKQKLALFNGEEAERKAVAAQKDPAK